ncbi:MAG: PIN domain nuclease [Acidimicrobiales bacterium]
MALTARYLADKSALARFPHPAVKRRLRPLLEDGWIATCGIVDLEVLYSARDLDDYEATLQERRALEDVPVTPQVVSKAVEIQHDLARRGQHRIPIPDLLIAAAADSAGLTVLHYDSDFELISEVSDVSQEWVVPRGRAN